MYRLRLLAGLAVLLFLIALLHDIPALRAQDGDPDDFALPEGVVVRPVSDIIDEPLEVTGFAPDGTATLPLTTSVPVACSMVYGTTPDFGSLTLDQDMAGGAHSDHSPIISGLEPETTYYYRVQGVDASGVIYISETMTFTTPTFDDVEITNLASPALGAEITGYSSAFGGAALDESWGAGSAFDGSQNSVWSSDGDGDDAWIEVTLAQRAHITEIEFWTRSMTNDTAQIFSFTITTGDGTIYGPFDLTNAEQSYSFEVDFEAQTLRFDAVDTNGGNTGAVEIGVYGEFIE